MSKNIHLFYAHLLKGIVIAFLYFETTKANDTTFKNISLFTLFYILMIYGAVITGIDANVITSAFLTKTVFTLVDERIRQNQEKNKD